jgi:hypothetical protein
MTDGFYPIYYTGKAGCGFGGLVFKGGISEAPFLAPAKYAPDRPTDSDYSLFRSMASKASGVTIITPS